MRYWAHLINTPQIWCHQKQAHLMAAQNKSTPRDVVEQRASLNDRHNQHTILDIPDVQSGDLHIARRCTVL